MDRKLQEEIKKLTKGIVFYDLLILLGLAITFNLNKAMVLGLIFGTIIAILNLRLLAISVTKTIAKPPTRAQIYSASQYLIRMGIMAVVLFVSAKAPHLNIVGTALGLLSTKFVILAQKLIIEKVKRKEA